ncbi:PucR family transcriptional regulator ligand-binding domain-containing protein [Streptomyces sp. NPDC056255]|uniref:PucR family transcriptional regulator ligand-binding domain-containing protein n=1 Tax=Streptomyces sp. NPDC056255 TaxID=3345764 RepID=UPI0035DD3D3A
MSLLPRAPAHGEGGQQRSGPLSWAHASELADPTPWLLGAEVIMTTGLAVPRTAAWQRAYLERLDDAGVSALALSAQLHMPPLHDPFFRAADERGFPVLEVPLAVPFIAVAQEVAASVQEDARHRLGAQLRVFGSLRWPVAEDLDTPTLLRRLERLSGYDVYLCTPQGRPLLPGVPAPDPGVLPDSVDAPPTVPGGFVLPVPAPGGPAGFLVAYERESAQPAGLAVVQHIATVAALRVAMVRNERETLRREGAETLAELLQEVLAPETAPRRLARHAIEGDTVLLVVRQTMDEALLHCLQDHPHLLLTRGEDRYVLGAPQLAVEIRGLAGVAAAMSRPFQPGRRAAGRTARGARGGLRGRRVGPPDDPLRGRLLGPLAARRPGGADRAGRARPR